MNRGEKGGNEKDEKIELNLFRFNRYIGYPIQGQHGGKKSCG